MQTTWGFFFMMSCFAIKVAWRLSPAQTTPHIIKHRIQPSANKSTESFSSLSHVCSLLLGHTATLTQCYLIFKHTLLPTHIHAKPEDIRLHAHAAQTPTHVQHRQHSCSEELHRPDSPCDSCHEPHYQLGFYRSSRSLCRSNRVLWSTSPQLNICILCFS